MILMSKFNCGLCPESYRFTRNGHKTEYTIHKANIGDFVVMNGEEQVIWDDIQACVLYVMERIEVDK